MIAVLLWGCGPNEDPPASTPATLVTAVSAVGIEVVPNDGPAPLTTWVRAVDEHGMAVASDPATIIANGSPVEVAFDALGHADLVRETPGTAVIDVGGVQVALHATTGPFLAFGLNSAAGPATAAPAFRTVSLDEAEALTDGTAVWWQPRDGRPAHRVLTPTSTIEGLRARHIDVDGFIDAVAWSSDHVFLLKARLQGGMARMGVLSGDGLTVGGADVADLDGDNLPDLAIAWNHADGTSWIDVWHGDGLGAFAAIEPRTLPAPASDLAAGDNTGEGQVQVTVALQDGTWSRWIEGAPGALIPIGPATPSAVDLPADVTIEIQGDLNGDGADEMVALAPYVTGVERNLALYELDRDVLRIGLPDKVAATTGWGDGNQDGTTDLWVLDESGQLEILWFEDVDVGDGAYHPSDVGTLPSSGPLTTGLWFEGDTVPDLFVASADLWTWSLGRVPADLIGPFWAPGAPQSRHVGVGLPHGLLVHEVDGDPTTVDVVHFVDDALGTRVRAVAFGRESGTVLGSVVVGEEGGPILDYDLCGDTLWVLADGEVSSIDLFQPAPRKLGDAPTQATRVACGTLGGGAEAALLANGEIASISASFAVVGERLPAPSAVDLAIADIGSGPTIQTCSEAACRMTSWTWGTGQQALVTGFVDRTEVRTATATTRYAGGGTPAIVDVDRDGHLDALVTGPRGTGSVTALFRSTGEGWAPPRFWTLDAEPIPPLAVGDATGDGSDDLWWTDATGAIFHSSTPYAPAPTTYDTGLPLDTAVTDTAATP